MHRIYSIKGRDCFPSYRIYSLEIPAAEMSSSPAHMKRRLEDLDPVSEELEDEWMIMYTMVQTRELVFAVDCMSFVLQHTYLQFRNFVYANNFGVKRGSDFDDVMTRFVSLNLPIHAQTIQETLERNLNLVEPNYGEFKKFVNAAAISAQSYEYFGCFAFLTFCVQIAQMSTLGFMHGMSKAPDFGIILICRAFSCIKKIALLPDDKWKLLKETASSWIDLRTRNGPNAVSEVIDES